MLKVAVLIDQLETLDQSQDTTIALLSYGIRRGHSVSIFYQEDIYSIDGTIYCKVSKIAFQNDRFIHKRLLDIEKIEDFDIVFLRKDPPVDIRFQSTMSLLATLESKVLYVNSPTSILFDPDCPATIAAPAPSTVMKLWSPVPVKASLNTLPIEFPR